MKGKLYGVSIGPGDPSMMTLKAVSVLKKCDVICYPVKESDGKSTALNIISEVIDLDDRLVRPIVFSMDPNKNKRKKSEDEAIMTLCSMLDKGLDVAMITLGDAEIYSTFMYVNDGVSSAGFETEIVPGISSFSYGASRAKLPLVLDEQTLCIIPMATDESCKLKESLSNYDNIIVMKAGNSIEMIHKLMIQSAIPDECATVMSNVGMADEYIGSIRTDRKYGYFTTVLIKKIL